MKKPPRTFAPAILPGSAPGLGSKGVYGQTPPRKSSPKSGGLGRSPILPDPATCDVPEPYQSNAPAADAALVEKARSEIEKARRDVLGFVEGGQAHLTDEQVNWLSFRLSSFSDREACALSKVPFTSVIAWKSEAEFCAVLEAGLSNKRDAFRTLGTQLLPKALRAISKMLDSNSPTTQSKGLNLLLKAQGLLIENTKTHNTDLVLELVAHLREPIAVESYTPTLPSLQAAPSEEALETAILES